MALFDRWKGRPETVPVRDPGPVQYERSDVQPPPWPRPLAAIRKEVFPASFVQSGPLVATHPSWVVAATLGRRTIGYTHVIRAEREASGCYFDEIAVRPKHRHQGVGRELVRQSAIWMLEEGFETIFAVALKDAEKLRREAWFESMGLRDSGWSAYRADLVELVEKLNRR
ncbi:MAG: GNAT family N-acetyltransferase [Acidimicrobiales bacterium]